MKGSILKGATNLASTSGLCTDTYGIHCAPSFYKSMGTTLRLVTEGTSEVASWTADVMIGSVPEEMDEGSCISGCYGRLRSGVQ